MYIIGAVSRPAVHDSRGVSNRWTEWSNGTWEQNMGLDFQLEHGTRFSTEMWDLNYDFSSGTWGLKHGTEAWELAKLPRSG